MYKFILSWTVKSGGSKIGPEWEDVIRLLIFLKSSQGGVSLYRLDEQDYIVSTIQVSVSNEFYLLTSLDDKGEVLTLFNPLAHNKMVEILGDYWSERQLTMDFELIKIAFKEFFHTGSVSKNILS